MDCGRFVPVSLLALIFLNLLQFSYGIRCYTCQYMDGRGDRECLNSPPPSRYLTECSQPQCWKKYAEYNGMINVQRFCGAYAGERAYCQQSSFENVVRGEIYPATECFCRTEGCNNSPKLLFFNRVPGNGILVSLLIASSIILVTQI